MTPYYTSLNRIHFTYYLNPFGTRNLEFKPGWNIFDWEKPYEQYVSSSGAVKLVPPKSEGKFPP